MFMSLIERTTLFRESLPIEKINLKRRQLTPNSLELQLNDYEGPLKLDVKVFYKESVKYHRNITRESRGHIPLPDNVNEKNAKEILKSYINGIAKGDYKVYITDDGRVEIE